MPLKITKQQKPAPVAKAEIVTEKKDAGVTVAENVKQETPTIAGAPEIKSTDKQWCVVGYAGGYTHNLGNYQSARVDVSLTIPCEHGEIDDVFTIAKGWVEERVQKEITDFEAATSGA